MDDHVRIRVAGSDACAAVLEQLASGVADTWSELVGGRWPMVVRVLHPAYRVIGTGVTSVRWHEIRPDIGPNDSWHDVSGVRLHVGRTGPGWDVEPAVGPLDPSWHARLVETLTDARAAHLRIGEWDGYASDQDEGPVCASGHRAWRLHDVDDVPRWLERFGSGGGPLPSLFWPSDMSWLACSDVDLPSTVIGCGATLGEALLRSSEIEALEVNPTDRITA